MSPSGGVALRAVEPSDLDALFDAATTPDVGDRWRYRDGVPTQAAFAADLESGTFGECAIVCRRTDQAALGLVHAYGTDAHAGRCYVGAMARPASLGTGLLVFGMALFIERLFAERPMRMVHFQIYDFNRRFVDGLVRAGARLDGVLKDDLCWGNRYHDQYVVTFTREAWDAGPRQRLVRRGMVA
jgi:RimJ/RimL family protein N-acetyltransferase